jgi:hypothetical protein
MKKFGTFYGHLELLLATWYTLWPFSNLVVSWYIFLRFGILNKEQSGNPVVT